MTLYGRQGSLRAALQRIVDEADRQRAPKTPVAELDPHAYVPSAKHQGDCAVCGHLQGAAIHSPSRRP